MRTYSVVLVLFFLLSAISCSHTPAPPPTLAKQVRNQAAHIDKPVVVLVSLDGFRADYIEKYNPPYLTKFAQQGVRAEGLIPIFPSLTFPNHYALATGLTAEHHSILGNHFYDPRKQREYRVGQPSVLEGSWYGGTPLWVAASKNGMVSTSYFWVGSEAEIQGLRPDEYFKYDEAKPNQDRVNKVLEWLRRPAEERPHMITLYFSDVDTAGHQAGPDSELVKKAVLKVDQELGPLFEEAARMPFAVDIIVVSDHGMEAIDPLKKGRALDKYYDAKDFKVFVNGGTQVFLYANSPDKTNSAYRKLKKAEKNFKVYLKKDIPENFHFKNHPSAPDILVSADLSYSIGTQDKLLQSHPGGAHGYDPKHKSMWGIFIARGPQFKENVRLPAIQNINVAPLILQILGIASEQKLDGHADVFKAGLNEK